MSFYLSPTLGTCYQKTEGDQKLTTIDRMRLTKPFSVSIGSC